MDDRDNFAAAALMGFIRGMPSDSMFHVGLLTRQSYEVADAMLRERAVKRNPEPYEKSDEKRVYYDTTRADAIAETIRAVTTPLADTQEPVAWAAGDISHRMIEVHATRKAAENAKFEAAMGIACQEWEVFPLYRHPQPTLTDAEREAVEWAIYEGPLRSQAEGAEQRADTLRKMLERTKETK